MKSVLNWLMVLLLVVSCTHKYVDYDVIDKRAFRDRPEQRPVAPSLVRGKRDHMEQCFNQWLFFSNADSQRNHYLPNAVQLLCPEANWLLEARITQRWWTTLFFSRACVSITAHCPVKGR